MSAKSCEMLVPIKISPAISATPKMSVPTRLGPRLSLASISEEAEALAIERPFKGQRAALADPPQASHPYTFKLLRVDERTKKHAPIGKTICDGRCPRRCHQSGQGQTRSRPEVPKRRHPRGAGQWDRRTSCRLLRRHRGTPVFQQRSGV